MPSPPLPACVAIGPVALAASAYWLACQRFRLAAAIGAPELAREAIGAVVTAHAIGLWPAPVHRLAADRLPLLADEFRQLLEGSLA